MTDADPKKAIQVDEAEKLLPLVLEIIPGHAAEGLIDIYEPGSYEGKSLKRLCDRTLNKKNWSIEEQLIVEDVTRQLEGGKLLCRGQDIDGTALEFAVSEQTEAGEKYFYVPIRAIKPQEGGCPKTPFSREVFANLFLDESHQNNLPLPRREEIEGRGKY